jgi:hypothetical protein
VITSLVVAGMVLAICAGLFSAYADAERGAARISKDRAAIACR